MDIIEYGSNNFAAYINRNRNPEKITKLISMLANQFISYRDFSNKLILAVKQLHEFQNMDDLKQIQERVAVFFPTLFKAGLTQLWINNSLTGIMQTWTHESKKQNCFPGKGKILVKPSLQFMILCPSGIFQDVIRGKLSINMKNQIVNRYLYLTLNGMDDSSLSQVTQQSMNSIVQSTQQELQMSSQTQSYSCQSSFCLPIIIDDEVVGILEASECSMSEGFGLDEELLGVVCSNYLSIVLKRIRIQREQAIMIKYQDVLLECFQQCIQSESMLNLEKCVHRQLENYFGINDCRLYFTDSEINHQHFYSLMSKSTFSSNKGVIGEALSLLNPILTNQIQASANYNPFVDIKTILPTLTIPLLHKLQKDNTLQCFGVIQIPLKKRIQITKEKDQFLLGSTPLLGVDQSLENILKSYANILAQAVKFIKLQNQISELH